MNVGELYIYPIKSMAGVEVQCADLSDRGLKYDRRWMLVDQSGRFISQRDSSALALFQTAIIDDTVKISWRGDENNFVQIPLRVSSGGMMPVTVWDDTCQAIVAAENYNQWFSKLLEMQCKLVYMPESTLRKVDEKYIQRQTDITSFADGYPLLMISKGSLEDLNERLTDKIPMNRFRPNLVIENAPPYEEDMLAHFQINHIDFFGVKLCARCVITTIDQQNAMRSKEPLRTLASYRMRDNNIYFGQNILFHGNGTLHVGDSIKVISKKEKPEFNKRKNNAES